MTEYIPRDTPIYCFFNPESERDVARVQQTRDNWKKRWGYTNFILQRRQHTMNAIQTMMEPSYFTGLHREMQKPGMEDHWPRKGDILHVSINFLYLLKKLRSRPGPSIIIQSNTLLKNDIELENYENDITFFSLLSNFLVADTVTNKMRRAQASQVKVRVASGLMVSQEMAKATYSYHTKLFNNPHFSIQSEGLKELSKESVISPTFFIRPMPGCKHNGEDMRYKHEEDFYGFTVPN